ncbi:hypothetical protein MVEN_00005500 [Mycena venus]|uniref:Uncharacterized protein n=1 Tax=Mycena venus TaxID=2733690 RepID=A0A8H6Z615_9AGAR|nr:hypothetical protein MVEN_00005500 [Mycena venus]
MFFSAGNQATSTTHRKELLAGMRNLEYYDYTVFGKISREDATISDTVAAMMDMGLDSDSDDESEVENSRGDNTWSPHGSKTMFMLDLLDNLLRLRLSDDQLRTIIWVMRECKTPDVPSFSALRKKQAELTKNINIQTRHHVSAMGNEFFMNHPAELLALDWANPLVREFLQVYPEITDHISEFNHADKWATEIDLDDLSPMWPIMWADWKNSGHKHFYIKELAQLKNGEFVVPMRWVIFKKQEYAEAHKVIHYPESGHFIIREKEIVRVKATDLKYNYLDLAGAGYSIHFPEWVQKMPNPVRKIANGRPVFSLRIIPWSDDVSGNVSKQYNPHMNVYMANACLPHRKVSQEYFIRFCSTSPHASSGEQFEALAEDLDKYHEAYDCQLEQEILFRVFAHALPADNPQQAESASNAGVHANLWCRYDMTSGELGALLWFPEIRNQEQYLALQADVQVCIDNVLDIWAVVDPARIMTKYKLHVLPHLPDDIRRFGPPVLFATESFECWNTIFRLCSILSNHQAPSHDIAITLADMERFKHQVSGGWWKPTGSQEYVQAGRNVRVFLETNKELQRRLGWVDKMKPKPG